MSRNRKRSHGNAPPATIVVSSLKGTTVVLEEVSVSQADLSADTLADKSKRQHYQSRMPLYSREKTYEGYFGFKASQRLLEEALVVDEGKPYVDRLEGPDGRSEDGGVYSWKTSRE